MRWRMAGKPVNEKAKGRAEWAFLVTYQQAKLADLLEPVRAGFARYDAGEIDAFGLDDVIHRYQEAARELWQFCSVSGARVETAVRALELWRERGELPDWWQVAERSRRGKSDSAPGPAAAPSERPVRPPGHGSPCRLS